MPALECNDLTRTFGDGQGTQSVLRGVSMSFAAGETCVLLGPSGSGKTTLLSILGLLLSPSDGEVRIDGDNVRFADRDELVARRRTQIGFVFQHAQLLPFLTLAENVRVVARNAGLSEADARARTAELLERLGIAELADMLPAQASGGQRQRAAIARALVHRPRIVLADEPTAALDRDNGERAVRALIEQTVTEGSLLVTVTHDTRLVPMFDRVLAIEAGRIEERGKP